MTPMETFRKKLDITLLGLLLGCISGFLSTIYLGQLETFFRPAFVFWCFCALLVWIALKPKQGRIALLLLSFHGIMIVNYFSVGLATLAALWGTPMVYLALVNLFGMKTYRVFVLSMIPIMGGVFLIDFLELGCDVKLDIDEWLGLPVPASRFYGNFKAAIILWQSLTLAAIALQLHEERLYRQRLAALESAPIPPHDHEA